MDSEKEHETATAQDIARAEFQKRRNRLGILTAEQERAIEFLLMSTVEKISHHVARVKSSIRPSA